VHQVGFTEKYITMHGPTNWGGGGEAPTSSSSGCVSGDAYVSSMPTKACIIIYAHHIIVTREQE